MAKLLTTDTRTGKQYTTPQEWGREELEHWVEHAKQQSANPVLSYKIIE